jgi:hypothetical protein
VRLEGLGQLKNPMILSGIQTCDLPACSIVPYTSDRRLQAGFGNCLRRTGNMCTHTTTASICRCRTSTQLSTNHRALTKQFDFPQLYAVMVVNYIQIGKYEFWFDVVVKQELTFTHEVTSPCQSYYLCI